jgi:hypothetical protein
LKKTILKDEKIRGLKDSRTAACHFVANSTNQQSTHQKYLRTVIPGVFPFYGFCKKRYLSSLIKPMETTNPELTRAARIAAELKAKGHDNDFIIESLRKEGYDDTTTLALIRVMEDGVSNARRSAGQRNMLYGALWCIGGIIVTVATYSAASGGGRYFICYGAIIFGAAQFIKGLTQMNG